MRSLDHARLADALLASVLAAGRVEMTHYDAGVEAERKSDQSPVTVADREAEEILLEGLAKVEPGMPVIAEERFSAGKVPEAAGTFFLVDPLDGTKEFVGRRGEFTINVGLVVDRRPVFGLVYAPALSMFFATVGGDRAIEAALPVQAQVASLQRCQVTDLRTRMPDARALVALESRSHRTAATDAYLSRFAVRECRKAGSSLKFCLIARGEADLYPRIGPTMEWDTAAGDAVLRAAGGSVTTLDGAPLAYGKSADGYLNPDFVAWARGPIAPKV